MEMRLYELARGEWQPERLERADACVPVEKPIRSLTERSLMVAPDRKRTPLIPSRQCPDRSLLLVLGRLREATMGQMIIGFVWLFGVVIALVGALVLAWFGATSAESSMLQEVGTLTRGLTIVGIV